MGEAFCCFLKFRRLLAFDDLWKIFEALQDEKIIKAKLTEMLSEGARTRSQRQPQLPLVRLRVTYTEPWLNVMVIALFFCFVRVN